MKQIETFDMKENGLRAGIRMVLQSPGWRAVGIFAFAAIIIAARRWHQLVRPDVWMEDGTIVIPAFVRLGWAALFEPVEGYLVIPGKLISYISLTLTFYHYAIVSTVLAIATQAAAVAAIAIAPTILGAPILAALVVPILPIGSECFALPSYTFWWTSLLMFVGLFWRDGRLLGWRIAAIVIGGLSSPFIIAACPIFALRVAVQRTRDSAAALGAALVVAAVQGFFVMREHAKGMSIMRANGGSTLDALDHLPELISKYFGTALYSLGQHGAGPFGALVVAFLIVGILALPRERRLVYIMLAMSLGAALVSSVSRVPVSAPHPLLAGPRYFFFPTILIGWMLVMLVREGQRIAGLTAMLIAGAYVPAFAAAFTYQPEVAKVPWADQATACVAAPNEYTFDIQYGLPQISWTSTLKGEDCRRLEDAALWQEQHAAADGRAQPAGVQ